MTAETTVARREIPHNDAKKTQRYPRTGYRNLKNSPRPRRNRIVEIFKKRCDCREEVVYPNADKNPIEATTLVARISPEVSCEDGSKSSK